MRDGADTGTVLVELLQPGPELVQRCQAEAVHVGGGGFLQGLQHVAQGQTQRHVSVRGKEREGRGGGEGGGMTLFLLGISNLVI